MCIKGDSKFQVQILRGDKYLYNKQFLYRALGKKSLYSIKNTDCPNKVSSIENFQPTTKNNEKNIRYVYWKMF